MLGLFAANAQDKNNPWAVTIGINAVDPYPVGEDAPQGPWFDEFFNATDHWNIFPAITKLAVSRYLDDGFVFTATGTFNQIEKFGSIADANGDEVTNRLPEELNYFAVDGMVSYGFKELIKSNTFDPYLGVGGGYTWIDSKGAGTLNGTLGLRVWVSELVGVDFQTSYKHTFETDNVPRHFQHSVGITFAFGGKDTDGDGIYDQDDACPEEAGLEEFNGCPDSDSDGIEDAKDDCPYEAGLAEFNGCPDSDGDGVMDKEDKCPTVAGLKELEGCPDADGDGIADGDDSCPNEAGPKENGGCPWPDTDGDGILDKDDECPNVAGTALMKGCPELSEAVKASLRDYAKKIQFETGKTALTNESLGILANVKAIMAEYPNAKFHIEGHTDSTGSEKTNQRLSEGRAQAVKDYLVANGVDEFRLSSKGYGESQPIADNNTRLGRKENRRVEIKVVNQD
jgi:outer membrane protein OmpA-like peptidoglycan-associated protein